MNCVRFPVVGSTSIQNFIGNMCLGIKLLNVKFYVFIHKLSHAQSQSCVALAIRQTLCRRAYTYKSQGSKPEKPAAEESETSAEAKEEASTPSDGAAEKPSSGGHHHSVTRQLPLATWLSLSPYGSSRLSSLPLWINFQHLGD